MRVVATYNIKGGVGKTSAAVNLGYLAARDGMRTLIWDLDPQGSATYLFRVKPKVKGGGKALVAGRRTLDEAIKETDFDRLDLMPADFSYRNLDLDLDSTQAADRPAPPAGRAPRRRVRAGHPRLPAERVAGVGERVRPATCCSSR
jgi:cellulose biosynthesis protein BcsQ